MNPTVLPTSDLAFKKLFANPEHPRIIQGFLGDFFDLKVATDEIRIDNPYSIKPQKARSLQSDPALDESALKATFRDVTIRVKAADITIEMQLARQAPYVKRALYYLTDLYTSNHKTSKEPAGNFDSLKPVWSISILGFNLFDDDRAYRLFSFHDNDTGAPLAPALLNIGFFELRKRTKNEIHIHWQKFFNSGIVAPDAPPYLREAARLIEYHNLSPEERKMIDAETKANDIARSIYLTAVREGHAEGRAAGHAEGRAAGHAEGLTEGHAEGLSEGLTEGIRQTAKAMLAEGLDFNLVVKVTGLTHEQVAALSEE